MSKYDPYGECREFRDCIGRIIGVHPDDLEERAGMDNMSDEDIAAATKMNQLMTEIVSCNALSPQVVLTSQTISQDALVCCISVPPATPDEDATQRIMRHILEIKRIALEFNHQ